MKSTAAYVRISSDKQDVSSQRLSIERWAKRNQPIALWFEDAEGKNPRDLPHKRAGFQRLLKAVEAGIVDCIVVDSQDRFGTRDAHQWGAFVTKLRDHGCQLLDATGRDLSADDDGAVLTGVVGALTSTREQREKAHRNVRGKVPKAQRGEYQGGYPAYGFDVVCIGENGREKWRTLYVAHYDRWKVYASGERERFKGKDNAPAKDPSDKLYLRPSIEKRRLEVVREIFRWYATELISPRQIATRLNTAKVDPVFGELWDKVKVKQLLGNPAYIGLPTWNKRGASRFAEWAAGDVRTVAKTNGAAKQGRRRPKSDYVQPEEPAFKPIVDAKTWARVQEKLCAASDEQLAIPKRSAKTDELWLKPFLICGHCGKGMRATRGESPQSSNRVWPSYYCGTYGTYGKKNPTGCHCHRIKHEFIESLILDYIRETCPKTAELMKAVQTGNVELARPLYEALFHGEADLGGLACDMITFVAEHGTERDEQKDFLEGYAAVFARLRPGLEKEISKREAELDKMLAGYADLTGGVRDRARQRMESLEAEVKRLRSQMADLRRPWEGLSADVAARKQAYEQARKILGNGAAGRQKAEAFGRVVSRIVCRFKHNNGQENHAKSTLVSVEIEPLEGGPVTCFTNGNMPGQGL
jgi:DNA invertase Pin-like site-specific DNA recombinase